MSVRDVMDHAMHAKLEKTPDAHGDAMMGVMVNTGGLLIAQTGRFMIMYAQPAVCPLTFAPQSQMQSSQGLGLPMVTQTVARSVVMQASQSMDYHALFAHLANTRTGQPVSPALHAVMANTAQAATTRTLGHVSHALIDCTPHTNLMQPPYKNPEAVTG
jgi:hypothetical protein